MTQYWSIRNSACHWIKKIQNSFENIKFPKSKEKRYLKISTEKMYIWEEHNCEIAIHFLSRNHVKISAIKSKNIKKEERRHIKPAS